MRKLRAHLLNLAFVTLCYLGLFENSVPAWNIFRSLFWICFVVCASSMFLDGKDLKESRDACAKIPRWSSVIVDLAVIVMLAWNAHFWLVAAWFLQMVFERSFWSREI